MIYNNKKITINYLKDIDSKFILLLEDLDYILFRKKYKI